MPEQNTNRALTEAAADEWKVLPSGLTVLVRPMPGYSGTHVIYATRFGSIDRDFRVDGREVHLPAGVAHFLEHKMFEDGRRCLCKVRQDRCQCQCLYQL